MQTQSVYQSADPNKPATFEQVMAQLNAECDRAMIKKRLDYGNLNIAVWDVLGVAVRLTDKVMRLRELILSGRPPQKSRQTLPSIPQLRAHSPAGLYPGAPMPPENTAEGGTDL